MADQLPSPPLPADVSVDERGPDNVSPASPASSLRGHMSNIMDFSPSRILRRSGYNKMGPNYESSPGHTTASASPPQLPPLDKSLSDLSSGLGISGPGYESCDIRHSSIRRVPVGSKTVSDSAETPRSHHGLLGSISSATSTPSMGNMYKGGSPQQFCRYGDKGSSGDDFDDELFVQGYGQPPRYCNSSGDIHTKRTSWLAVTVYILSIYSTVFSGIWLIVAIIQPRWGRGISSRDARLDPSTATTVFALISKTIEMSFVTVFISFLGQVLTRRSFLRRTSGMTLGEMTMRNWVIQPGSLITHAESVPRASMSIMGALSLTATVAAMLYTTASEGMVAPKLKYGDWAQKELLGHVRSPYANVKYVEATCPRLLSEEDPDHSAESCMNVQASGQSYRNLMNLMATWAAIDNSSNGVARLTQRPVGTTLLYDNTTMKGTWIETHNSDVAASFEKHRRIINNVTMAMPHPGVYEAATSKLNGILQPEDLSGVGSYSVKAGVVSPSINVLCANMDPDELSPLIYTEWPDSITEPTGVGSQVIGHAGWDDEVPKPVDGRGRDHFLNSTTVDDIFEWGPDYGRRPPVFQLYPSDYNLITNSSVYLSDSIYTLGKNVASSNYTLCQLRSWLSPNCSTRLDISGTSGSTMTAHCEDPDDLDSYWRSIPGNKEWPPSAADWKWLADSWRLSMDLNGGVYNNNASNARILTQLSFDEPELPASLPSVAEALAVYASSTLVVGAIDTPFRHYWEWEETQLDAPGSLQAFNASLRTQQYTSGHVSDWQGVFYVVLSIVFAVNVFCLAYFVLRSGLVTDFTEPQNLFALAVNSPPSEKLKGSCGGGPGKRDLAVPWRVAYAPSANHYFFEEARGRATSSEVTSSFQDSPGAVTSHLYPNGHRSGSSSYKRLSSQRGWLW